MKAIIFDLDGVLTDTAEYHYRGWQRLADEEGLPFDRAANEALRGVSRRESLLLILQGRQVSEDALEVMMARKNRYYQEMLQEITPADLLPGVAELLDALSREGIPCAVASASRNAQEVVDRLGIADRLAVLADGNSVTRAKPAPDLFRHAAARLGYPPSQCLVIEDAAAGIEAAVAAGMPALAVGPAGRFDPALFAGGLPVARRDDLLGLTVAELAAIGRPGDGWSILQEAFEPGKMHHMETVFTIGNGTFSSRGTFEEGYPGDMALTLAHGVFDDVPVFFTELANLPNWLDFRITVDGYPFRLDYGELLSFCRRLDMRRGVILREVRWRAASGAVVDVTFERFASYSRPHLGAMRVLITAAEQPCVIAVEAGIDGHVANDGLLHWRHLEQDSRDGIAWLHSRTRHSGIELGAAARLTGAGDRPVTYQNCPGQPALRFEGALEAGQTLCAEKIARYVFSRNIDDNGSNRGAEPAVVENALQQLAGQSFESLKAEQIADWADVWRRIDVIIEGDEEAQQAMRFSLFQLQVAAPRHDERVSIGAKTLSGLGYRGHVFWDTDIFVLPFFIYTQPEIARNMLMYRYHTLEGARRKAAGNGYSGAQYAWESASTGDEVTPPFLPDFSGKNLVRIWTGDIELHITADVAYAVMQYWRVTGDDAFMRDYGAEIILDTARYWGDRAGREEVGDGRYQYAIRDVIGPDEYHDHVDNNVFTNAMVRWHLETAIKLFHWLVEQHGPKAARLARQLDLNEERLAHWRDVARNLVIHFDRETGLMEQFDGFFKLKEVNWPDYETRDLSMQALLGIEGANEHQVLKQADVLLLLCLFREEYTREVWLANWNYYSPRTDHSYGSSLGPSIHAWAASEMQQPEVAYEHFMRAARADLKDVRGNAGDGIHAASAGGLWQAAVFGFAGLRLIDGRLVAESRLPRHWRQLAFAITYRGERYWVDVQSDAAPNISPTTSQLDEQQQPKEVMWTSENNPADL